MRARPTDRATHAPHEAAKASSPFGEYPSRSGRKRNRAYLLRKRDKLRDKATGKQKLFMVYCEGGGMPTRLHTEFATAAKQAARLAWQNPGRRFHILSSHRIHCRAAIATEAGTAETLKDGSVHEGDRHD